MPSVALALAALFLAAPPAAPAPAPFDKVLLTDGRLIEGKLLEPTDDETTPLEIRGIVIPVPNEKIDKTYVEDLEDYVPKNSKEEKYLEKGWVLFEGRWMSRTRREQELAERREAAEKAIAETRRLQDWKNARVLETPRFRITYNVTEDEIRVYSEALETYYKYFVDAWNITLSPGQRKDKLRIFIYRTGSDYYKYGGGRYGTLGYFSPLTEDLHLFHDPTDLSFSLRILFHEANHLITHLIDPRFLYPRWLNESMAEYYGSSIIDEKGDFQPGNLLYDRIVAINAMEQVGRGMEIEDVLMTPSSGFGSLHYAYGWSFVHFLMTHPDYGRTLETFYGNMPNARDIPMRNQEFRELDYATMKVVEERDVLSALEKRLGRTIDQLADEYREWRPGVFADQMPPRAYHQAARMTLGMPEEDDAHVVRAFELLQKAVDAGSTDAECYRQYAEMLRKGGVSEANHVSLPREPDLPMALEMIERAIELDPLQASFYCEAAGILLPDSPVQDLDRAAAMTITARAIAPDNPSIRSLYDDLVQQIRDGREVIARREAAEAAAKEAAANLAGWIILPFYIEGDPEPERITDLSLDDVRRMIHEGEVDGLDWAFNTLPALDPVSGEELPLKPWEKEWLQLKDIGLFAEDLEQVGWTEEPPARSRR